MLPGNYSVGTGYFGYQNYLNWKKKTPNFGTSRGPKHNNEMPINESRKNVKFIRWPFKCVGHFAKHSFNLLPFTFVILISFIVMTLSDVFDSVLLHLYSGNNNVTKTGCTISFF